MSACVSMRTPSSRAASATANASSSQRTSAPVRSALSAVCAAVAVGAPYQTSVSLFEPPGRLMATIRTCDCTHMTFSTNWRSAACPNAGTSACDRTRRGWRPSVTPGRGKKSARTSARFAERIAAGVVDGVAAGVEHVVDGAGGGVPGAAALGRFVAVGPLVVSGRVDERIVEAAPQLRDGAVVGLGAVLLARVDVADVEHQLDVTVGVDRVDERRRGVELGVIGRRGSVRRVAVDRQHRPVASARGQRARLVRQARRCRRQEATHEHDRNQGSAHRLLRRESSADRTQSCATGGRTLGIVAVTTATATTECRAGTRR